MPQRTGLAGDVPAFHRISTRSVAAGDRLDYWRSQFQASYIDQPRACRGQGFESDMLASAPVGDVAFAHLRGDPVTCRFGTRASGLVLLGCVSAGVVAICHGHGHGQTVTVGPDGGLVLFDCDRPFTTSSQSYAMTYLALPRALVVRALGDDPVAPDEAVRILPSGMLADGLHRHLREMVVQGMDLAAGDANEAVRIARALAISLLAGLRPHWRSLPQSLDRALLDAARHQLRLHAGNPDFTAAQLAMALGCSRAHLYRLFERDGQTITGQLREYRLEHARQLLETRPGEPVGMIAMRCGYTDLSAFGKAFRRQFDLTPSECRHLAKIRNA